MKSNRKPKKFSSQPDTVKAGSHLNFHGLFRYSFPHGTPTARIECTIYLDDQDLDFGDLTHHNLIEAHAVMWRQDLLLHSHQKNGKGTQGLQRGAFVVQCISFKRGPNCQSRMIGGNNKNPSLLNLVQIAVRWAKITWKSHKHPQWRGTWQPPILLPTPSSDKKYGFMVWVPHH